MTEAEIYEKLGLEDPDEYAIKRVRRNVSERIVDALGRRMAMRYLHRGTGNTTRTLVAALRYAKDHPGRTVYIVGRQRRDPTKLVARARAWARCIGLPKGVIVEGRGFQSGENVFRDVAWDYGQDKHDEER